MTVGECLGDNSEYWYRKPTWVSPISQAQDGCLVSDGEFCGKLQEFGSKTDCFKSNADCQKQVEECMAMDTGLPTCSAMKDICSLQFLFCATCGGSKEACETGNLDIDTQA